MHDKMLWRKWIHLRPKLGRSYLPDYLCVAVIDSPYVPGCNRKQKRAKEEEAIERKKGSFVFECGH